MVRKILIGECFCATLVPSRVVTLFVIDSNRLPSTDLNIGWIDLDGTQYSINDVFATLTSLLSYLNTTFVIVNSLGGTFTIGSGGIIYSNPENFITAEIMAIIQNKMLRFGMGGAEAINEPYTSTMANDNVITDASLVGVEVLSVQVNRQMSEPITLSGWIFYGGTISFPIDNPPHDSNIYILVKQSV